MIDLFLEEMRAADIRHFVSVANGESAPLYFRLRQEPDFTVIDACREGEAVAIATGLNLGGRRSMLSMENFGLYESLDTFRSMATDWGVPIPVIIGYTARPKPNFAQAWSDRYGEIASQAIRGGVWTETVLDALSLPYALIEKEGDPDTNRKHLTDAINASGPYFLLTESF